MKEFIKNMIDKCIISYSKVNEIKKFKDFRRVKICNSCELTKKQKKAIDEYYLKNYEKKIPYIWHMHNYAFSGHFDVRYFPELLYIPEFERFMNFDKSMNDFLEDKNNLYTIQDYLNVKMPKKIISCQSGTYMDSDNNVIDKSEVIKKLYDIGEKFYKVSVDTCSGVGCKLLNFEKGIEKNYNLKIEDLIDTLGTNFIIQERIKCHESLAEIYPDSVNTFRIITYRWKNKILHVPCMMRIGRNGSFLDNAHAGGIFIAIDDDGTLHEKAITEFKDEFYEHPNTNYVFKDKKIELFPNVLKKCISMHKQLPNVGVLNWDLTLDSEGDIVLIEINVNGGGIWAPQLCHGVPVFGDLTDEILRWTSLMKKTKLKDRKKYIFGNMKEGSK